MLLLSVPVALLTISGLLVLASRLEQQRASVTVRMSMRNKAASPELCEAVAASELAPLLTAQGLL